MGPAVNFSASENRVRGPPPALGQHTDQVLLTKSRIGSVLIKHITQVLRDHLGMDEVEIAELRRAGVIV